MCGVCATDLSPTCGMQAGWLIEAILGGRGPSGLSLAKLTKTLPLLWHKQRERFGFPQSMLRQLR